MSKTIKMLCNISFTGYLLAESVSNLLDDLAVRSRYFLVVAYVALCLLVAGLFAAKHGVPDYFDRIYANLSRENFE